MIGGFSLLLAKFSLLLVKFTLNHYVSNFKATSSYEYVQFKLGY